MIRIFLFVIQGVVLTNTYAHASAWQSQAVLLMSEPVCHSGSPSFQPVAGDIS